VTLLVTGASGFLGRHLVRFLGNSQTQEVIAVSRRSTDTPGVLACDLTNRASIADLLDRYRPTNIYHLAASASGTFEVDLNNNVFAARNILDSLTHSKNKTRVLLVGSSAEYGLVDPEENPISETKVLQPISVYGWTKAAQTHLASYYCWATGLDVVVARIFNLFGKGMPEHLFVGRVEREIQAVIANKAERIRVGGLDSTRDYIDVEEACRAIEIIMDRGLSGQVYNVGCGKPVKMRDLLKRMLADASLDFGIVEERSYSKPGAAKEVTAIYADITRLKALSANYS